MSRVEDGRVRDPGRLSAVTGCRGPATGIQLGNAGVAPTDLEGCPVKEGENVVQNDLPPTKEGIALGWEITMMKIFTRSRSRYALAVLALMCSAFEFAPRLGDEATYEVTTPVGTNITRRVLESYDEGKNRYEIGVYAEAQGKMQRQTDWVDAAKLEESFIGDLGTFCSSRAGQEVAAEFEGRPLAACRTLKDNGVLKQEDFWIAGVPFGLLYAEKKSPLHPKAGTTTRLMSYKLAPR